MRIYHYDIVEDVLGFGKRLVFWVSGCPFRCNGCIASSFLNLEDGEFFSNKNIVDLINSSNIDGVTFTGGEPLYQANDLKEILDSIDIDTMLFTGYYKNELNELQLKCFSMFDLVVEGRFEIEKQGNFLFRGSSNQIISSPTAKYSDIIENLMKSKSKGLELVINNSEIMFYGIPTLNNEINRIANSLKGKIIIF